MRVIEKIYPDSKHHGVALELDNKPNLEDFINILLQNGYWVRLDFESETSSIDKVLVWIVEKWG